MKCDTCRYKHDCFVFDKSQMENCKAYEPEKKMTNADRIRAMSDEELARLLCGLIPADVCSLRCPGKDLCHNGNNGLVKWMKQPAEED